jgi:hypothetical protein
MQYATYIVLLRKSLKKPADDLLASFQQQFPEVAAASSSAAAENPLVPPAPLAERYVSNFRLIYRNAITSSLPYLCFESSPLVFTVGAEMLDNLAD